MNRAERRAMGIRGPAYTHSLRDPRPRFVRRHIKDTLDAIQSGRPLNRRARKASTRIGRAAVRLGIVR